MKYYVISDLHGFFFLTMDALGRAGYFEDQNPKKLIVLGDCFDRGPDAKEMQGWILSLWEDPDVIWIRGNHEDLFEDFLLRDVGRLRNHLITNGTVDTALQLTGFDIGMAQGARSLFVKACLDTPYYKTIIPGMRDYYETQNYIFVHGYVPAYAEGIRITRVKPDWRNASEGEWKSARWFNGMEAARTAPTWKTVVCGHFHTSYGHSRIEGKCPEFGVGADFSPYYGEGVIAIDGCTAYSGKVNCVVLEDTELEGSK